VLATCDPSKYSSLYLRLNDTWFEVRPSTYILNATFESLGEAYIGYCAIGIVPQSSNFVILGAPFMKNYYMIFDIDSDRLGISNLYSSSRQFQGSLPEKRVDPNNGKGQPTTPTTDPTQINTLDSFVIYGVLIIIILLLTLFIIILVAAIWYFGFRQQMTSAPLQ
jgi:Eukaryotic aspartyl protease